MEQEIDLRPYFLAIARRWRLILLLALIAAVTAASLTLALPNRYRYQATALVSMLIRQTGSEIGIDRPLVAIQSIDVGARRQGLVRLSQSSSIEASLPHEVLQQVTEPGYRPGMLANGGRIEVVQTGDILEIRATGATPEAAKLLADAWAQTFVEQAQTIFDDDHSRVRLAGVATLPYAPLSSGVVRNTAIAGFLGIIIGLVAAIALEFVRRPGSAPLPAPRERAVGEPTPTR